MQLSDARLIASLSVRVRVSIRRVLLALQRSQGAETAFLLLATDQGRYSETVECSGESGALPAYRAVAGPYSSECELRTFVCRDRELRDTVVLFRWMCRDAPLLVLGIVDSKLSLTDIVTDAMESAIEEIVTLMVDAVESPRSATR